MHARTDLVSFFFFSSRRRHTRLQGDWSSDVCSSDLARSSRRRSGRRRSSRARNDEREPPGRAGLSDRRRGGREIDHEEPARSEERRVGKEGRARWWREREKQKRKRTAEQNRRRQDAR